MKGQQGPADFMQNAIRVALEATEETPVTEDGKDPAAVSLGRKGGLKGGKARAEKMTPEQRSEAARKAVQARWEKKKG